MVLRISFIKYYLTGSSHLQNLVTFKISVLDENWAHKQLSITKIGCKRSKFENTEVKILNGCKYISRVTWYKARKKIKCFCAK